MQWEKDNLFDKLCCPQLDSYMQNNETGPKNYTLTLYPKINPKWIKDLNVRPEARKFLEESIGNNPYDISLKNIFLDMPPLAGETKAKLNNFYLSKEKTFAQQNKKDNLLNERRDLQVIYPIRG